MFINFKKIYIYFFQNEIFFIYIPDFPMNGLMSPTNATLGGSNPNMNGIMSPSIVPQNNIGIS